MRYSQSIKFDEKDNMMSLTYYSIIYLTTADRFLQNCKDLEEKYSGGGDENISTELNSYVNGVILNTIAFLEAIVNEAIYELNDSETYWFKDVNVETRRYFQKLGELNIPGNSYSTLDKYQFVTKLISNTNFVKGEQPYQDVALLIQLRNSLIHYKPKWKNFGENESLSDEFYIKLNHKFNSNPFFKDEPYFPFKCLGYGCARWALKSALNFTDLFYEKIDIKPIYVFQLSKLKINNIA